MAWARVLRVSILAVCLAAGCAEEIRPKGPATDQYGCSAPPPDVLKTVGIDAKFAQSTFGKVVTGDINISLDPEVVTLASQAMTDERIRSYLRCLAIKRDGFTPEQQTYLEEMYGFLGIKPSPDRFIEWKKLHPFPRSAEPTTEQPLERGHVRWATRLWNGETMTVRVGDIPSHARGRYIAGELSTVRFNKESCEWETIGPVRHHELGIVAWHVNRAGPNVKPYPGIEDTGTVSSKCHSPLRNEMLLLGVEVKFDHEGRLHAGGFNILLRQRDPPLGEFVVPSSQP